MQALSLQGLTCQILPATICQSRPLLFLFAAQPADPIRNARAQPLNLRMSWTPSTVAPLVSAPLFPAPNDAKRCTGVVTKADQIGDPDGSAWGDVVASNNPVYWPLRMRKETESRRNMTHTQLCQAQTQLFSSESWKAVANRARRQFGWSPFAEDIYERFRSHVDNSMGLVREQTCLLRDTNTTELDRLGEELKDPVEMMHGMIDSISTDLRENLREVYQFSNQLKESQEELRTLLSGAVPEFCPYFKDVGDITNYEPYPGFPKPNEAEPLFLDEVCQRLNNNRNARTGQSQARSICDQLIAKNSKKSPDALKRYNLRVWGVVREASRSVVQKHSNAWIGLKKRCLQSLDSLIKEMQGDGERLVCQLERPHAAQYTELHEESQTKLVTDAVCHYQDAYEQIYNPAWQDVSFPSTMYRAYPAANTPPAELPAWFVAEALEIGATFSVTFYRRAKTTEDLIGPEVQKLVQSKFLDSVAQRLRRDLGLFQVTDGMKRQATEDCSSSPELEEARREAKRTRRALDEIEWVHPVSLLTMPGPGLRLGILCSASALRMVTPAGRVMLQRSCGRGPVRGEASSGEEVSGKKGRGWKHNE